MQTARLKTSGMLLGIGGGGSDLIFFFFFAIFSYQLEIYFGETRKAL